MQCVSIILCNGTSNKNYALYQTCSPCSAIHTLFRWKLQNFKTPPQITCMIFLPIMAPALIMVPPVLFPPNA